MSDKDKTTKKPEQDEDEGLDDLLDSALKDFDKVDKKTATADGESSKQSDTTAAALADLPPGWNDEFLKNQADTFADRMAAMFGGSDQGEISQDQFMTGFQRMAEAAGMALNADTENVADPAISQSITEALRGLSEGAEGLQSPFNPDDIADMFGNINLADTSGNNPFLPFMQGMMQSLLSAEILLPSLQDLCTKYPEWMTANAATVEPADKERYEKQLELMKSVISDLETEREDDSAEVKNERFQKVFGKMQRMQDLGQPPPELVEVGPLPDPSMFGGAMGNFPPGMMGGGGGNPGDAGGQPQCGMM